MLSIITGTPRCVTWHNPDPNVAGSSAIWNFWGHQECFQWLAVCNFSAAGITERASVRQLGYLCLVSNHVCCMDYCFNFGFVVRTVKVCWLVVLLFVSAHLDLQCIHLLHLYHLPLLLISLYGPVSKFL